MKFKIFNIFKKFNLKKTILLGLTSILFCCIAAVATVLVVSYIGNLNFQETFYSVGSIKVNERRRVIQVTDLHNSRFGNHNEKLIDRITKLDPDIIVISGDGIEADDKSNDVLIEFCRAIAPVAPTYYIYGNNEVDYVYDFKITLDELDEHFGTTAGTRNPQDLLDVEDPLKAQIEATGVKVLKNEYDSVKIGADVFDVYGVLNSNPSSFWPYAGASFGDYLYKNPENFKLTVIHEPYIFAELNSDTWGDCVLAGHTHGGIVRIPYVGAVYERGYGILPERSGGYVYGQYLISGGRIIVSSGLSNRGWIRVNNPPELVIIDINRY